MYILQCISSHVLVHFIKQPLKQLHCFKCETMEGGGGLPCPFLKINKSALI